MGTILLSDEKNKITFIIVNSWSNKKNWNVALSHWHSFHFEFTLQCEIIFYFVLKFWRFWCNCIFFGIFFWNSSLFWIFIFFAISCYVMGSSGIKWDLFVEFYFFRNCIRYQTQHFFVKCISDQRHHNLHSSNAPFQQTSNNFLKTAYFAQPATITFFTASTKI